MASYPIIPIHTVTDNNGKPSPGAKVYFYAAGTTDLLDLFSDQALSNAVANPVIADAYGRFIIPFFAGGAFKIVATTSAGATLNWPAIDDYSSFVQSVGGNVPVNQGGTGSDNAEDALTALGAASASDVSDLSTALTEVVDELDSIGGSLGSIAALNEITIENLASGFAEVCVQSFTLYPGTKTITGAAAAIPLNTTGTSIVSQAITPQNINNIIEVWASIQFTASTANTKSIFACRSDITAAQAVSSAYFTAAAGQLYLLARFTAGTTSSIDVSVRGASDTGTITTDNIYSQKSIVIIREFLPTTPVS